MSAKDCVPVLRAAGLDGMASWAEARPVRMGGRGRTCQDLWDVAPRGEWLLRYARVVGAPRPALVRAAVACVRPSLRFVPAGQDRPLQAVEAAEAWADRPTERNRRRMREAGEAAWAVTKGWAEGQAAWAAEAREAAGAAGWAALESAEAARRAAWAHYEAEGLESLAAADAACAAEVRRIIPFIDLAGGRRLGGR